MILKIQCEKPGQKHSQVKPYDTQNSNSGMFSLNSKERYYFRIKTDIFSNTCCPLNSNKFNQKHDLILLAGRKATILMPTFLQIPQATQGPTFDVAIHVP